MRMKLMSIHIENFKGITDETYYFGKITRVNGENRLGKTTIATAFYYLFSDKNYELESNPDIRPDDGRECIPTVTAVVDVDGKEIILAKMQKCRVSEPDTNGVSHVVISNSYEINSIPKSARDFKAYMEDLGLSFDKFLACSHPDMFTKDLSQKKKQDEMRKYLFAMSHSRTDLEIAQMSKDTSDVAKLLESYSVDEIKAMNNASKKKAVEQLDAIPNQIIGLEKAKVDVDVAEQELAKADLERKISECDQKISGADNSLDLLRGESMKLKFDMSGIMQIMDRELSAQRREVENALFECNESSINLSVLLSSREKTVSDNSDAIAAAENERKKLGEQYNAEKAKTFDETPYLFDESKWVFDENSTVCSLCGQKLPEDKIEQLKTDFEAKKAKAKAEATTKHTIASNDFKSLKASNLQKIIDAGFEKKNLIEKLTSDNESMKEEIKKIEQDKADILAKKNDLEKRLSEIPTEADYTQNEEYAKLKARHNEVLTEIEKLESDGADQIVNDLKAEKSDLQSQLDEVNKVIAQAANNARIDEQIEEMTLKQRKYGQAKASAEKILYQLSEVSKRKNDLLVSEINSHFNIVRWKLYDYQKNGEYKEICVPTVLDEKTGIYKVFGKTTNTGREIEAKIDICNSFQKFFDMQVPIILDKAESINNKYIPSVDTQLILLTVTEDKQLKVEGV